MYAGVTRIDLISFVQPQKIETYICMYVDSNKDKQTEVDLVSSFQPECMYACMYAGVTKIDLISFFQPVCMYVCMYVDSTKVEQTEIDVVSFLKPVCMYVCMCVCMHICIYILTRMSKLKLMLHAS